MIIAILITMIKIKKIYINILKNVLVEIILWNFIVKGNKK